jgi:hypothetical protein
VDRISELETETIRSQAQVVRLEQELGRVLQQRDHLEDQLRRLGGLRKAGQEDNAGGDVGGGGIIHSVHILTGGENTKNSQSQNFGHPRGMMGGNSSGVNNSYFHHQPQQQQQHTYQHHPARLLSQSETNLATAAAAAADGAINIEIRHNNGGNSNADNHLSRSSGDLLSNRLGGGVAASKSGGVSVVNLPAVVNNSAGSSAEELYYGGDSAGGNNAFSRFGGGGSSAAAAGAGRYNNYLYPDRPRFFPQQLQHNSTGRLAAFNSIIGGRSPAVGGKLQQLLSQERQLHNRSRSVENLLFDQQTAGGVGLRYAATASSEISLQPRPAAAYYGETMRSAASATAVGGGGGSSNGRSQHYQQRMKATQSEQFLTKIGKLEKVRRQFLYTFFQTIF